MLDILERIVAGEGEEGDIETLEELADTISHTALCGLGKTAAFPVISTIKNFRSEYVAHIRDKHCPAGSCQKLKHLVIDPAKCIGCTKCKRACPVEAIVGVPKKPHMIYTVKCIKCMACITNCPVQAISAEYGVTAAAAVAAATAGADSGTVNTIAAISAAAREAL
jgi:NADH-quinone oxidoreductase subunit F